MAQRFAMWLMATLGVPEALGFQTLQRSVDAAQQHIAAGRFLQFASDRHAVGVLADSQDGEQDHQLVVAQGFAAHLIKYTEYCTVWQRAPSRATSSPSACG